MIFGGSNFFIFHFSKSFVLGYFGASQKTSGGGGIFNFLVGDFWKMCRPWILMESTWFAPFGFGIPEISFTYILRLRHTGEISFKNIRKIVLAENMFQKMSSKHYFLLPSTNQFDFSPLIKYRISNPSKQRKTRGNNC